MQELSFNLEVFEGPLELLLHLLKKNKVSIYDIPIEKITTQYMEYLEKMQSFDMVEKRHRTLRTIRSAYNKLTVIKINLFQERVLSADYQGKVSTNRCNIRKADILNHTV